MQREFFNLENIMLGGLFLILLIYSGFMISCTQPDSGGFPSNLFSSDRGGDDVAIADRRGNTRDRRPCDSRDSCQDSCDYMFRNSSARSACYDLNFDDVSELQYVFDGLNSSSISKRSLEDIDVDDFEEFLDIDVDGWVDIIVGEEGRDRSSNTPYSSAEAKSALEWIAENKNVARAIEDQDEYHDILYHLFLRLGDLGDGVSATTTFSLTIAETGGSSATNIDWHTTYLELNSSSNNRLSLVGDYILEFVLSFIGSHTNLKFSRDSFISYAEREDNEAAIDLAHESLVRFCEDATDEELPDEDVQQCMMAAYCSIYDAEDSDNIFEDVLNNHNADPEDCASDRITDDNVLEGLFG